MILLLSTKATTGCGVHVEATEKPLPDWLPPGGVEQYVNNAVSDMLEMFGSGEARYWPRMGTHMHTHSCIHDPVAGKYETPPHNDRHGDSLHQSSMYAFGKI